jgi:hypothetical protein
VAISDPWSNATIYYTTDGTTPTANSPVYVNPITVSSNTTLKAIATAVGDAPSAVSSATYTITSAVATPTFSPAGGTYSSSQAVTLADSTTGATIYYTTDGATPTTGSNKYTGAITVSATETIQAIAVAANYSNSAIASATYTIGLPPATTPAFAPAAGTYTSAQTVTITDTTSNATIYYTTDGTTPTTGSNKYTGAITVSATETIQAIAVAANHSNSAVASAAYTINLPAPDFTISGTAVTVAPGAATGNTSTITVTPSGGFTGSVALTAAITSSPSGAVSPPTLSFGSTSPVSITGAAAGTATLTVSTTEATSTCTSANLRDHGIFWHAAGGAALACVLLFGIPARRRRWLAALGMVALLVTLAGGVLACGGSQASGCSAKVGTPGTTAGSYAVTVTGTSSSITQTATVTLTVQ